MNVKKYDKNILCVKLCKYIKICWILTLPTSTDAGFQSTGSLQLMFFGIYWHCPCEVWHPSNQKCTFSSNFKTLKHLGPSLCFKQLFHLKAKWSKCEHIESINRAKASRVLNPCLCSIVIYITCHQQITTSRNPAIEERKRHLLSFASCPWTWSWTQQHTTKQLPGERQVSPSSICSPHMAKASMQAWKRRRKGATVTTCHDQSHFNTIDLVLLIAKREFPRNGVAPGWWKHFDGLSGSLEINITGWGEGLRKRTCSLSFYVILCTMDARYNIFWKRMEKES